MKPCLIAVPMAAILCLAAQAALAQPHTVAKPKPAPVKHVKLTGTVLDAGVESLKLDDAAQTKVADAVKTWKDKVDADKAKLADQRKDLAAKIKAEKEKDKLKALKDELAKLPKNPTDAELYKGARDAIKAAGALSDDQLTKVDAAAREAMVATATKTFETTVANWSKKDVSLTADEKAKVDAVGAKIKDEVAKLDLGASTIGLNSKLIAEAVATLPADKVEKLKAHSTSSAPAKAPHKE
ncbi:MAG: hypothetical protein PHU85_16370 [Phycisphaerae bacterium]|nr:hypothetical protein [Phycisphaerae bacterium]